MNPAPAVVPRRFSRGVVLVAGSCSPCPRDREEFKDAGVLCEVAVRREVLDGAGRGPGGGGCRGRLPATGAVRPGRRGVDDEELRAFDRVVPALVCADGPDLAGGGGATCLVHVVVGGGGRAGWCPGARCPADQWGVDRRPGDGGARGEHRAGGRAAGVAVV